MKKSLKKKGKIYKKSEEKSESILISLFSFIQNHKLIF